MNINNSLYKILQKSPTVCNDRGQPNQQVSMFAKLKKKSIDKGVTKTQLLNVMNVNTEDNIIVHILHNNKNSYNALYYNFYLIYSGNLRKNWQ